MAIITVTGTATRIFFDNRGVEVTEFFTGRDGEQKTRKYTAWFNQPVTFPADSNGTFTGNLSVKNEQWTDAKNETRYTAKIAINDATFEPNPTNPPASDNDDFMPF